MELKRRITKLEKLYAEGNRIMHNMVVANQSAYIAEKFDKNGDAITWIENGLFGPGHIPYEAGEKGIDANEWYKLNIIDVFNEKSIN